MFPLEDALNNKRSENSIPESPAASEEGYILTVLGDNDIFSKFAHWDNSDKEMVFGVLLQIDARMLAADVQVLLPKCC